MQDVFDAGVGYVVTNNAIISAELKDQAAKGVSDFTLTMDVSFEPENLRLKGTHMETFFDGMQQELASEQLYSYDVAMALNESDTVQLKIDLVFTL